jgi:hypothetical protein|tara:strand:- start:129 stop:365 length:237 start_codon:yes stop_codon:yes gene_type:complete
MTQQNERVLEPTPGDLIGLAQSFLNEPMAQERLKGLILRRLLEEAEAQLVVANGAKEPDALYAATKDGVEKIDFPQEA